MAQLDAKLLVAIILPSLFASSVLFMFFVIWLRDRRKHKEGDAEALRRVHQTPNTVALTKETFTSPNYENYGISIHTTATPLPVSLASSPSSPESKPKLGLKLLPSPPPSKLTKSQRPSTAPSRSASIPPMTPVTAHYTTFTSRNSRSGERSPQFGMAATSIILPPNALNMHEKNLSSRSTLDLGDLVLPPPPPPATPKDIRWKT